MSYYQDVVTEYLRADRTMFVNTECLIQLDPTDSVSKGTHWYCDAVAVNFRQGKVYLCEVSYSKTLSALLKRLREWSTHWPAVRAALVRDCSVPEGWEVQPWAFVPEECLSLLEKVTSFPNVGKAAGQMPMPRVLALEAVAPWRYQAWDRKLAALSEHEESADSGVA